MNMSSTQSIETTTRRVKVAVSAAAKVAAAFFFAGVLLLLVFLPGLVHDESPQSITTATHRKLLPLIHGGRPMEKPYRDWGEKCVNSDVEISQSPSTPLPNGIPTYIVEIVNTCYTGCNISDIHLNCGWFSSVNLINPKIFKRLGYDDCLVNNGEPLVNGGLINFRYANTFLYPLSVSSVLCP